MATRLNSKQRCSAWPNGERLRPEQGCPVRLLLPGYEGNMNVKWLRRVKITQAPTHTKDETSKYSDMVPGGKAKQFTFEMGVKSVITPAVFWRKARAWFLSGDERADPAAGAHAQPRRIRRLLEEVIR